MDPGYYYLKMSSHFRIESLIVCLLLLFSCLEAGELPEHDKSSNVARSAAELISRILPSHASQFAIEVMPEKGKDLFEIESIDALVVLRGNNGVSIASAFHQYLKDYGKCHVSWNGDQLNLPKRLPVVPKKVSVECLHENRVYFNYCTLSYTASWWDWSRWEREIDFMAMNGFNTPLSVTGLEGVWYHALKKIGYSDEEARAYLVGPTYFAWQWMTNIQSHGGPLPKEWIDRHIALGRRILQRQRDLGMTPIQQGFTGCVPRSFIKKFPEADIVQKGKWCGFEGAAQLDPLDPLFKKFGRIFMKTQIELFGTSHLYATDPFHEGHPPKKGDAYLIKVGESIHDLISSVDPKAKYAMQAWSIREKICRSMPKDRLLVLDLAGRKRSFWGYNFVKGQLHNFGGRINLHGDLRDIASNPFAAVAKKVPENQGMGLFMESIEQNPVFYNLVFDMIWRDQPVDIQAWLESYTSRRYNGHSERVNQAWKLLLNGPYRRGTSGTEYSSIIAARPALRPVKSGPNLGFSIPYPPLSLWEAWGHLLYESEEFKNSAGYQFDVVDVGRQAMSNLGQEIHKNVAKAFKSKDKEAFKKWTTSFLGLLNDVDVLLATTKTHHFGKWVADAKRWSNDPELKRYYEYNASMLVTIWGPDGHPGIFDYSWREWSGLIGTYYKQRWSMFYDHLEDCLKRGRELEPAREKRYGYEAFRANAFYSQLADWELKWIRKKHELPSEPQGDAVLLAQQFFDKYQALAKTIYTEKALHKKRDHEKKAGKVIGSWSPKNVSRQWQPLKLDLTKELSSEGTYEVTFLYVDGKNKLSIKDVSLYENGKVLSKDAHTGSTGHVHQKNKYKFKLDDYAFNTTYTIQAQIKSHGGNDSHGYVHLKKVN